MDGDGDDDDDDDAVAAKGLEPEAPYKGAVSGGERAVGSCDDAQGVGTFRTKSDVLARVSIREEGRGEGGKLVGTDEERNLLVGLLAVAAKHRLISTLVFIGSSATTSCEARRVNAGVEVKEDWEVRG